MTEPLEFDPVDWITAGAVGEPGRRVFYIQARRGDDIVSIVCEKEQVRVLAQLAQELLARVDVLVTPDDLDASAQQLVEPVVPTWRAGNISIGMTEDGNRFVLEADELTDEEIGATARFWMGADQLAAMAAHAAYAVEIGARETCRFCNRPIDPVEGHVCPAANGHGPLTT
jgi:uncharacterized repeat protein (TIGR03847 family)